MKALEIDHLKFRYSPDTDWVLDIPQFSVEAGEKLFLKGPSGSGKTTLLNLVGGVLAPEKGSLKVLGQDFSSFTSRERDHFRADHMGFIFQDLNLIPYLSPLENVLLGLEFSEKKRDLSQEPEEEAIYLLESLGLRKEIYKKKSSVELSKGQEQRVAVARAFLGQPKLIIADEPTSALDADNRHKFLKILNDLAKKNKASILFVSHDPSLENEFDRLVDLKEINRIGGVESC